MRRVEAWTSLMVAVAGCGRVAFDGPADAPDAPDASRPDFGDGCVVGFRFEELEWTGAGGEVGDACGGDQPGTVAGGAKRIDDGVRGRVADFSSTLGDCVLVADEPALRIARAITMSAWVFPTALDTVNPYGIIAKRADDGVEVAYGMFAWTGNQVHVDIDTENDEVLSVGALANGTWQQVTTVYDGAKAASERVQIYINGTLDRTGAESAAAITPFTSALHVGCLPQQSAPNQQSFGGKLDDVGVWSRAFTPAEVDAWYLATRR